MTTEHAAAQWDLELDDLFVTIGHRFGRVELRRRIRDYVRGLLAPRTAGRTENSRRWAEFSLSPAGRVITG
ncbi:hypothetical protein [Streptomyces sp. NPDC058424]|uniref:hypothetical protein n=1 Tax=Streptomyces sp. NPDC058424 TaxID=3346491 RepID=UPI0036529436